MSAATTEAPGADLERSDVVEGEVLLTADQAQNLTARLKRTVGRADETIGLVLDLVRQAKDGRADLALSFPSWTAYLAEVFNGSKIGHLLDRDDRKELIELLSAEGMSTRAIAAVIGVTQSAVVKDMQRQVIPLESPEVIDPATGEVLTEPARVTGLDGKTYARSTLVAPAAAPRRRPITDAFWEAAYDLGKKAEFLLRLVEDDRWASNRDAVADKNLSQMRETVSTLARVLTALTENSQGAPLDPRSALSPIP